MTPSRKRLALIALPVFVCLALGVYFTGLRSLYFSDDYQFVFDLAPGTTPLTFFHANIDANNFYRPVQAALLWIIQHFAGLETFPIHLIHALLHGVFCWLIFLALASSGFSRTQAGIAALFMLASQANAHAVGSNDTFSQLASGLLGYVSVWLLHLHCSRGGSDRRLYPAALAALFVAYFLKESAVSFFLMNTTILGVHALRGREAGSWAGAFKLWVPMVLLTLVYLLIRGAVAGYQPSAGTEGYGFSLGLNVVKNTAMLLFASLLNFSTVTTFFALKSGDAALAGARIAVALALGAAVGLGLWRSRERAPFLAAAGAFALIGMFPVVLMAHVSELYVYNSMPALCALFGIGLGRCIETARRPAARAALIAGTAALLAVNAAAVHDKLRMMRENGERATGLYAQAAPLLGGVPAGGTLVLLNTARPELEYSVFRMKDFDVLEFGIHRFNQLAGRDDFEVLIAHDRSAFAHLDPASLLILTLDESGRVIEAESAPGAP